MSFPVAGRDLAPEPTTEALVGEGTVIGLDVGGTFLKAVVVGPQGALTRRVREPTKAEDGQEALVERVLSLLLHLRAKTAHQGEALAAIGLAVPGVVDETAGVACLAVNLGWQNLEIVRIVEERLGVPVHLGHDVRLGALAEGLLGSARSVSDFLFVPIGTGVASATVLQGQLWRGTHGLAGEIGHFVVEPGGAPCGCGKQGCLETVASASALVRRYRDRLPGPPVDTATVVALARGGDPHAAEVWTSAINALGNVLATIQALLDLDLIVIGGGLANVGVALSRELQAVIADRLGFQAAPRLALASLGDDAGCLGAAIVARSSAIGQYFPVQPVPGRE
jgi:glucokinase